MTPLPKALPKMHPLRYRLCLPSPNNNSRSDHVQAHARTSFHLSLHLRPWSMAPSMAPAVCAVKRQAACDTQSKSSTVSPSRRQWPCSLSAMRHLRRGPSLLRICSRHRHCHCHLKNRRLNRRRLRHNSNSNGRKPAGQHPSPGRVPLPHHH